MRSFGFGLILMSFIYVSCSNNKSTDYNSDVSNFYLDSIHNDPRILYADSLAWFFEQSKAEELFQNMLNSLEGSKKRFVQSRILAIQAEWDRIDPKLYEELNSLPNHQKDIHVMTALFWVNANRYALSDQKASDFYLIHYKVAYYLNQYNNDLNEMEEFINNHQNIKFKPSVLKKLFELAEIKLYSSQRDDDFKKLLLDKYGDTTQQKVSDEYYGKILVNKCFFYLATGEQIDKGDSTLKILEIISKYKEPCHYLNQKWHEYSFISKVWKTKDVNTKRLLADDLISKFETCPLIHTLPQYWVLHSGKNSLEKHKLSLENFLKSRPLLKHDLNFLLEFAFIDFYRDKRKFNEALKIAYHLNFNRAKVSNVDEALAYSQKYNDIFSSFRINNLLPIKLLQYEFEKSNQTLYECKKLCDKSYQLYNESMAHSKENQAHLMSQNAGISILDNIIYVYYLLSQKDPKYREDYLKFIIQSRANLLARDILTNQSHPIIAKERKLFKEKKMLEINGDFSSDVYQKTLLEYKIADKDRAEWSKKNLPYIEFFKDAIIPKPDENTTHIYIKFVRNNFHITLLNQCSQETYAIQLNEKINDRWHSLDTMIRSQSDDIQKFNDFASSLGQWLFPAKYQKLIRPNIVLHADDWFSRIPLSVLQFSSATSTSSWDNLPSIGKYYNISNSNDIPIKKSQFIKSDPNISIFTFSSEDDSHKKTSNTRNATSSLQMDELRESITEAYHIRSIFPNAKWYAGKSSTKAQFLKTLQDPTIDIIHLAQHGKANGSQPEDVKLYFKNSDGSIDSLMGPELIGLKTNASLIVLSACETGIGFEYIGEGTYSLGRYFMATGAQNILTSLWETDDKYTPKFMKKFYQDIKSSKGKVFQLNNNFGLNEHPKVVYPFLLQTY